MVARQLCITGLVKSRSRPDAQPSASQGSPVYKVRGHKILERCEAHCELHLAGAAEVVGVGSEKRLAGSEDRRRGRTEEADCRRTEIAVACAREVEDVEEEIEVAAFAAQRDVLHKTNVEVEE